MRQLSSTVHKCVRLLEKRFLESNIDEARQSAEYIIASALGHKTLHGIHPKTRLDPDTWAVVDRMVAMRLRHTPVQYVVGDWDFRQLCLRMRPPVLIPRPETQELVGHILSAICHEEESSFLEIGCGSGAISLSLLHEHPRLRGMAIDISEQACSLTDENARTYDLQNRLNIINSSLQEFKPEGRFDFVVSNPPYISTDDWKRLHPQVRNFEDPRALDGGPDGLDLIKVILERAPDLLSHGQREGQGCVWLEVDSKHPAEIESYVTDKVPRLRYVRTILDFMQRPRFCHLVLRS